MYVPCRRYDKLLLEQTHYLMELGNTEGPAHIKQKVGRASLQS